MIRMIRSNPENGSLWMQGLAALRGPGSREVLVELARGGLPGIHAGRAVAADLETVMRRHRTKVYSRGPEMVSCRGAQDKGS